MQATATFFNKNVTFWLLIYCVASLTVLQFIPIYFTAQTPRLIYYCIIYFALTCSSAVQLTIYFKKYRHYLITQILVTIFLAVGWLIAFLFVFSRFLGVWTEAGILYTSKANPEVRIVRRYLNLGAFGGGTEPGDYGIVLHRSITPYFKMETTIDTNKIDKTSWVKQ